MKTILLSFVTILTALSAQSQVICAGVSPTIIVANYEYGVQTHQGWPGQAGDGTWDLQMDFNIPGTFVQDTLMLVEDGTPGTNPQGNPMSQEGCSPLNNDLTGKIAVIYRNTCEFGTKLLNAQNAGAIAAIIVNREPVANFNMLGGVDGINVTIPAVFISSIDGESIINEMGNGPVVMFIGNKIGAFANDAGSNTGAALISPYGGAHEDVFDGFDIGIEVYNWGANSQANVNVTATIDGPSSQVYNETVGPLSMNSGDTISIFNGNPNEFPVFNLGGLGNYPAGDYTLTYTIDLGVADDSDFDNVLVSTFTVNSDVVTLANVSSANNTPVSSNYPSNSTTEYQSCMFYEEQNTASASLPIEGIYFVPYTDTAITPLAGEEIFINVYEWNDSWVDLADPLFVGGANNDWFLNLSQIAYETYYPATNDETGQVAYVPFTSVIPLDDNQRYLVCLQSFNPEVAFGYDNSLNYDANQSITAMPISPVYVDDTWYTGGWIGSSTPAIGLKVATVGLEETSTVKGMAFPNPAKDVVTVSVEANGNTSLTVTDITGKHAIDAELTLVNGNATVDLSALDAGVYVFNLLLEDGQTSQFNVVKK